MDFKRSPNTKFNEIDTLTKKEAKRELESLRVGINYHNKQYYEKSDPRISDAQYDKLFKRLKDLEEAFPDLKSKASPTQQVGSHPVEKLVKVKHTVPMMSLNAVTKESKVDDFFQSVNKKVKNKKPNFVAEPKFDGFSVEIVYEKGNFIHGVTRGDGTTGEDITHNLKILSALPKHLRSSKRPRFLAVRAEVFMLKKEFQELNKERINNGERAFANPRNAAAGMMRQLDPKKVKDKSLDIIFYECLKIEGQEFSSHWQKLNQLKKWGLKTDFHNKKISAAEEIKKYHKKISENRDNLNYEIDGIVIKCDDQDLRNKLGSRERSPNWALAWKFKPSEEVTILEDIVVQVGRTGMMTPVALLQPVDVGGVTVSRATLHNEDEVHKKDIRVGDKVRIVRAGDVIPEVVEQVSKKGKRANVFHMPDKCPSCSSKVYREGAYYSCASGLTCRAQLVGRLMHYASRTAMNIDGLGEETIKQLVDKNMVNDMADLYKLSQDDFMKLEGFSDKSSKKLYKAIHKSDEVAFDRFLYALGIKHVGRHIARILSNEYQDWESLAETQEKDLLSISEIGPEIAQSIKRFFDEKKNKEVIIRILKAGVSIEKPKIQRSDNLKDKTIVFTGELNDFTREEAKEEAESRGAHASSSVSGNTDYVVVGKEPGSKLEAAEKKKIKIINEEDFKELIKK